MDIPDFASRKRDRMYQKPKEIAALFSRDEIVDIAPHGNGHINSTFAITLKRADGGQYSLLLQKINHHVFRNVQGLMDNIRAVTDYLRAQLDEGADPDRAVLTVVPSQNGRLFEEVDGAYYRCYVFVRDTVTYQQIKTPRDFQRCGVAFGDFQRQLAAFPAHTLCETIPDFHNTEQRLNNLLAAIERDTAGRAAAVQEEIAFCLSRKQTACAIMDRLRRGEIPLRVTHNDTKLNNILFDRLSDRPLCIVDLDTVMPGAACYDFGDSIRFGASSAAEDERDLEKVYMDLSLFEAFTAGYVSVAKHFLTEAELESLPLGAVVMTLECGIRFLTDYLDGDVYFATHYEGQNLDRCRTQLRLVQDMEKKLPAMQALVARYAKG